MPDFRIHRNNSTSADHYPYIVDVQSDLLSALETRLAIPLVESSELSGGPIKNLNPKVSIGKTDYFVLTQQMAAIPKGMLGEPMENVEVDRSQVLSSIDFLITGI